MMLNALALITLVVAGSALLMLIGAGVLLAMTAPPEDEP